MFHPKLNFRQLLLLDIDSQEGIVIYWCANVFPLLDIIDLTFLPKV